MRGISCYHQFKEEEFEFDIVGECNDEMFHEPAYKCILLKKYQSSFQNGKNIFIVRKKLFAPDSLYKIIEEPEFEQMNLFDFIGD